MSILNDCIFSSSSFFGIGKFNFNQLSHRHKYLIKSITKRQREKFKRKGIVPIPALCVFWELGFLPGQIPPTKGMKIKHLLSFLEDGEYRDEQNLINGQWLFENIVRHELMFAAPKNLPPK